MNSQLSVTDKSHFFVLIGVKNGVIDRVDLFERELAANAALDRLRDNYHPEADDLQVFPVSLSTSSVNSLIDIIWTVEDIREVATNKGLSLTNDECVLILESLEDNYDASIGINWDLLNLAIDSYFHKNKTLKSKKEEARLLK